MDRDTVRMILLVLGILVIAGVYIWGRYREKLLDFINRQGEFDELAYEDEQPQSDKRKQEEPVEGTSFSTGEGELEIISEDNDEEDYALGREAASPPRARSSTEAAKDTTKTKAQLGAPFLIQLSVVASDDTFFNGEDLRDALVELDLIYGDMGIYHRYDREYREPQFSVASLVEPGTFPIEDMESFECPGVVLFFQPPQVDDPLAVFDDLVSTCHELAVKLDGIEWDETRQPLTEGKILQMRERLKAAY